MADRPYPAELREQLLERLRSGESVSEVAADSRVSRSTLYRWMRASGSRSVATDGKLADITGPGITDRWGVTSTDLGASILAPNGKLVSVFGDTFSGPKVSQGEWRSPVVLIGTGDTQNRIVYERAGGGDPNWARQLWDYSHDDASTRWTRGGVSTVLPSDLLRVEDSMYLHAIVNRGFPNVVWTEIWKSDHNGVS
jgi:transcriptional regulator with XRE-family HTH domain